MEIKNIIMVFVILLFVSGCGSGFFGRNKGGYSPTITSEDIYVGKDGLFMEFFENAPPSEVFERGVLPIGLRLYNKGAYDIQEGYLAVSVEKDYMELYNDLKSINDKVSLRDNHITFNLKGKTIEHPDGERDIITFTSGVKDLSQSDPQSEYHYSLVSITSCYKYETKAVKTVCIDTDVYGFKQREKSCEVETLTLDSQGGPVAVTRIESEMLPKKDREGWIEPRFLITVKNLGGGEVIKSSEEIIRGACSSDPIGRGDWNNITMKVYLSTMEDENKLDCDITNADRFDDGGLILKGGEDKIRCVYDKGFEEKEGTFSSPIYIILDYGYTDTISREIKIRKILTH